MPFEPKLFGASGPEPRDDSPSLPDRELPDELAALAQQLSDDAAMLAEVYPALEPQRWSATTAAGPPAESRRGPWVRTAAAVLLAAGLGIGGWLAAGPGAPLPEAHLRVPAAEEAVPQERSRQAVVPVDVSPLVPAGVFQALSGPEQEALLDLMEGEGLPQPSLSI